MSYHIKKSKGLRSDSGRSTRSLARVMTQGDQPKHPDQGGEYIGQVMTQAGRKSGSKGTTHMALGGVMKQGGSMKGNRA